jgi:hypothetical protein
MSNHLRRAIDEIDANERDRPDPADLVIDEPSCFDNGRCVGHEVYPGAGTSGMTYCTDAIDTADFDALAPYRACKVSR